MGLFVGCFLILGSLLNIPLIFLVIDFRSGSWKIQTSLQSLISPVCLSTSHVSWASFVSAFLFRFFVCRIYVE